MYQQSKPASFTTAVPVFGGKEVIHVEKMPPVAPNFDLSNAFDPPDVGNQGEVDLPLISTLRFCFRVFLTFSTKVLF
jgi:hypothetical protein